MPIMTPEPTTTDIDDFDKPASRGFVRYELVVTKMELKQDTANLRTELKQDIANLRTELKQDIADVRLELSHVRAEIIDRLAKLDRSLWWKLSITVIAASALSELFSRL